MNNDSNDPLCPKTWVIQRLKEHNLDYDYKTDALKKGDLIVEESLAISFLRLDAHELEATEVKSYIRDALNVYRHERSYDEVKLISQSLAFKHDYENDPIIAWVTAVCGKPSVLDITIIKHFIWQVKRKLAGLPVDNHIMPVVYGLSGIGKSVAVSKLLEPLKAVALQTDMSIFSDQFSRRAFTRNFIIFFDELQGSDNTDINSMKQTITAPVIEWRAMRSEKTMSAPQNSTFIGCSNDLVRDRIKDPTSSRRFWQINCASKIDWDKINNINYLELWKSVDELSPSTINDNLKEIRKIQEQEIRSKDIIEQWAEEICVITNYDDSSLTTAELYESFKKFCEWQSIKSFPQFQKFARDIQKILGGSTGAQPKKSNRGTTWPVKIRTSEAVSALTTIDSHEAQLTFNFEVA